MTQSSGQLDAAICSKCFKKLDASQGCAGADSQADVRPCVVACGSVSLYAVTRQQRQGMALLCSLLPPSSALVGSRLLPKALPCVRNLLPTVRVRQGGSR